MSNKADSHDGKKKGSNFRKASAQVLATVAFGSLIFSVSAICNMSTVVLGGNYNVTSSEIPFNEQQASWFGSVVFVVQPLGSLCSGFIQDVFGRRRCMMAVTLPQLAGWIILCFAPNLATLYFAAVMMGLSIGFMEAPAMSFLGEVTEPKYRGILSTFSEVFLLLGALFEYFVGAILPWRLACIASASLPVIAFIFIYIVPESPVWLLVKERREEAEEALCWLRGWTRPDQVKEEFNRLVTSLGLNHSKEYIALENKQIAQQGPTIKPSGSSTFEQFKHLIKPRVFNPILLVSTYFFVGHCTSLLGYKPVLVSLLAEMNMPLSPYTVMILTGFLLLLGAIVCSCVIRPLGKRGVTFISLGGTTTTCLLLAIYQYLNQGPRWIPLLLLCVLFFCSGLGVLPLPWVLCCEVFPLDCRGLAAGISAALSYIFSFLITKTFLDLKSAMTLPGVTLLYGIIGVAGLIFLYYRLPETEGKSLDEVELFFNKEKSIKSINE